MGADTFTPPGYTRQADLEPIVVQPETEVSHESSLTEAESDASQPESNTSQAEMRGVLVARIANNGEAIIELGRQQRLAELPIFK